MSKKKHPEHVNHERWLVSYADFITLLFAFFVVLFASGQSDKHKQAKLAAAIDTAFKHDGIFEAHAKTPPLTDASAPPRNVAPAAVAPLQSPASNGARGDGTRRSQEEMQHSIERAIREQSLHQSFGPGTIAVHSSPEGLVITLREAGFFASGSAELRPGALPMLRAVAAALPAQPMRVEGHTDDVPIHTGQFASNWELSTARASTITRLLLAEGRLDPASVVAAGYAEFRPAASNQTEAGRAQNRRVDIVLLHSSASAVAPPPKS